MKEKIKNFLKRAIIKLKSPFFEILLGIAVIPVICVVSYNFNKKELGYAMKQTSIYLKKQCLSFNRYDDAAVTRGIIRIIENVQQIVRNIDLRKSVTNKDLERYTFEQRLTGSFVLDEKNNIVCEYSSDYEDVEKLKKYCLNNKSLLDTAKFLKKTYAIRLRNSDFSYVDVVAHGRKDCRGVVVGFYYTSAEYARNYNLNFQNFLEGYIPSSQLMIVVSSNTKIIASNERRLLDSSTKDNPLFRKVLLNKKNGDVVHVKTKEFDCFGIAENCRDFSIFIFAPVRGMLKNVLKTVLLAGFFYLFLLFIFYMARRRSAFIAELRQKKKEAEYQRNLLESAKKAEQANIAKTEFLHRMSHDIRTPINGIRGMIEIADYYKDNQQKQNECRQKIWETSGYLLELVNEVLDMGKLESGEIVLEEREFDLKAMLDEIISVIERLGVSRGIKINIDYSKVHHFKLIGSPLHLKRVLMNIASNAVKYNKENGRIKICVTEKEIDRCNTYIEFDCADTGIGMSEEYSAHIFEPFSQENTGARTQFGGSGLGMAIVKKLVDKMNGSVNFKSEKNIGTVFSVSLPFNLCHKDSPIEENKENKKNVSHFGIKILVAEDNALNMEIAEFSLKREGFLLEKARNGKEAFEIFKNSKEDEFSAVIMDIMMPEMDGLEATKKIRALPRSDAKKVPIIAMTANAFSDDRIKAFEAGMTDHLAKPIDSKTLVQMLEKYLPAKIQD